MRCRKVQWSGRSVALGALVYALLCPDPILRAQVRPPDPDETAFRALYKELVEINTTLSVGSCTAAAEAMAARLKAAGFRRVTCRCSRRRIGRKMAR